MSKLKPINGHIIVRDIEKDEEENMYGNIVVPDMLYESKTYVEVIETSEMYNWNLGEYVPSLVKKGDIIMIPTPQNKGIEIDGEEVRIIDPNQILAILKK